MINKEWKDTTSYSQSEKREERIPRSWTMKVNDQTEITVHRHIYFGDTWLLTCRGIDISQHNLYENDLEKAKFKALNSVVTKLESVLVETTDLINDIKLIQSK